MIFKSPGSVIFSIGDFNIYAYGVTMALACLVGIVVSHLVCKKFYPEENADNIWDISLVLLISGFIGARLYFCMLNPIYYLGEPLKILNFREGGLSVHGGLAAGIGAILVMCKKYKTSIPKFLDVFSCGMPIAQSIGRWGNFFNSEAFGAPTNLPLKLYVPLSNRPIGMENIEYFHPTFLYESILDFLVFLILLHVISRNNKARKGLTFFCSLFLYGAVRFFVEALRVDSALNIQGIPVAQAVSIVLMSVGLIGFLIINFKINKIR